MASQANLPANIMDDIFATAGEVLIMIHLNCKFLL